MIEDLEVKSDALLEKLILLQEDSEINAGRSEEEIQRLRKRISETEDELEIIKRKGISIKVIDSNIVKMQKERNIAGHPANPLAKPIRLPGYRNGSTVGAATHKPTPPPSQSNENFLSHNKRPIIAQKRKSFQHNDSNMPEKSVTQNFMEETIGLRTIISETETDGQNSISAFASPNRETLTRVSDMNRSSRDGASWVGSRRDIGGGGKGVEGMVEGKRGEKRGSKVGGNEGLSDTEARDIKKF